MDMPRALPPVVLLEGSYQRMFGSMDELIRWVEAIDVRSGEYTVLDRSGRVIALTAESDSSPVHAAATDDVATDRLEQALRDAVSNSPGRWRLIHADVGLDALVQAIWRTEYPKRAFPTLHLPTPTVHMKGIGFRLALLLAFVAAGCGGALPAHSNTAPPGSPAASGVTREVAINAARAAAGRFANAAVLKADVGPLEDFVSELVAAHISPAPSRDQVVWRITLGEQPSPTGGQGVDVFIDYRDGRVLFVGDWVS
jgi:hypothetical protein